MTRCTIDTNDNRQVAYPVQPRRSLWGKVPFKKPITVAWSSCRLVLSLKDRRRTSTPDKPSTDISREAAPKVRCTPMSRLTSKTPQHRSICPNKNCLNQTKAYAESVLARGLITSDGRESTSNISSSMHSWVSTCNQATKWVLRKQFKCLSRNWHELNWVDINWHELSFKWGASLEPPHGGHWSFCQIWFAPHPCAWVNNINTTNQTGNILNTIRLYVAQLTTHDRRKTHMTIIRHMSCNEVAPWQFQAKAMFPHFPSIPCLHNSPWCFLHSPLGWRT